MKKLLALTVATTLTLGLTACVPGVNSITDKNDSSNSESTKAPINTVGSTVTTEDGVSVTLKSIRKATKAKYAKPNNEFFVILEFEIDNGSSDDVAVSSVMSFDMTSESGHTYDVAIFADLKSSLDGTAKAGRKLVGEVAFDVNEESLYYVTFKPSLMSDDIEFQFSPSDITGK